MTFGPVAGVKEGDKFPDRRALYDADVHRTLQAGIVGRQNEGAESVVLSGGYADDEDLGDVILYTGQGFEGEAQVWHPIDPRDQTFTNKNKALLHNHLEQIPLRVIRGNLNPSPYSPSSGYRYDGLFSVDRCWRERSKHHGFLVCRYRLIKIQSAETELPQNDDEDNSVSGPAPRKKSNSTRIVRDQSLARKIKQQHNYKCQVCGEAIEVEGGLYAEAAHIRPLGRPHDGPDIAENLLCLCPNHHVAFDNGSLFISDEFQIIEHASVLRTVSRHRPAPEYFRYHRQIWGRD